MPISIRMLDYNTLHRLKIKSASAKTRHSSLCAYEKANCFRVPSVPLLRLPIAQGGFERFTHGSNFYTGLQQFRDIHHTVRARGFGGHFVKFRIILPEFEFAVRLEDFLDHFDNLPRRYKAWIRD